MPDKKKKTGSDIDWSNIPDDAKKQTVSDIDWGSIPDDATGTGSSTNTLATPSKQTVSTENKPIETTSQQPVVSPFLPIPKEQPVSSAPTTIEAPHDYGRKLFGTKPVSAPNAPSQEQASPFLPVPKDQIPDEATRTKLQTEEAYKGVAQAVLDNQDLLPAHEQEAVRTGNLLHTANPLTTITDIHGDPNTTGAFAQSYLAKLQKQKEDAIKGAGGLDLPLSKEESDKATQAIDEKEAKARKELGQIIGLQLFNKEVATNNATPKMSKKDSENALSLIDKKEQEDLRLKQLNTSLSGSNASALNFSEKAKLEKEREDILRSYTKQRVDIKNKSQWDNTRLGVEYEALLGDRQAIEDKRRLDEGLPINPLYKLRYDISGAGIIENGSKNADANGQVQVASNVKPHLVTPEKIEKENQQIFNQQRAKDIGEAIYNDQNWVQTTLGALLPKQPPTKEQISEYGKRNGLTDEQIAKIDPKDIPTQATLPGQFAKSFINSAAPLYEFPFRAAALAGIANKDVVNEMFPAGWENQRGLGTAFAQNTPEAQAHGAMGLLGHVTEGIGGLAGLEASVGQVGKVLKASKLLNPLGNVAKAYAEMAPEEYAAALADKTQDMAFKTTMFMQGYNDAYKNSLEIIGDKDNPVDEAKRQAYAILNGIGTTSIFSISPKTGLIKNILPEATSKDVINQLAKEGLKAFENKDFKQKFIEGIESAAKENGKQVSLAVASQVYTNIENAFASKTNNYQVGDNLKETAMSTAVAMLAPSIIHGVMHPSNQNPINKQLLFEMGANPEKYGKEINKLFTDGKLSEQEAKTAMDAIQKMNGIIKSVPNDDGTNNIPLTAEDKINFAWSDLQSKLLEDKKRGLLEGDARIKRIDDALKEVNAKKQQILDNAGKKAEEPTPIVLPKDENLGNAPKTLQDILSESTVEDYINDNPNLTEFGIEKARGRDKQEVLKTQKERGTLAYKYLNGEISAEEYATSEALGYNKGLPESHYKEIADEEASKWKDRLKDVLSESEQKNIPNNSEKNISLESKGITEPKTEQNGKEENVRSGTEEHRQEQQASSEVHSEANGEAGNEGQKGNRKLSEEPVAGTPKEKVQQEAATPPAEPVLKKKRKFVEEPEEKPVVSEEPKTTATQEAEKVSNPDKIVAKFDELKTEQDESSSQSVKDKKAAKIDELINELPKNAAHFLRNEDSIVADLKEKGLLKIEC